MTHSSSSYAHNPLLLLPPRQALKQTTRARLALAAACAVWLLGCDPKPNSDTGSAPRSTTSETASDLVSSRSPTSAARTPSPAAGTAASGDSPTLHAATPAKTRQEEIALGQKLVSTSGCHDCHTPFKMGPRGPEPDRTRSLSGHPADLALPPAPAPQGPWLVAVTATNTAWSGPWGVSYTANLTPDPQTGLGKWTREQFVQTIRTGRHLGRGRPILPPMPVPVYQNFSDAELGAIFEYLHSIPAIENRVPSPLPPA